MEAFNEMRPIEYVLGEFAAQKAKLLRVGA